MKTVREVAEELNVSRQTIYSKLTVDFKERFTSIKSIRNRDTLVINSDGIEELKKNIDKSYNQHDSQIDNDFNNQLVEILNKNIETLQKQLKVKDEQIIELNKRLQEAQDLNKNSQILLHREQDKLEKIESKEKFSFKKLLGLDKKAKN